MKKFLLVLALFCAFCLAACDNSTVPGENDPHIKANFGGDVTLPNFSASNLKVEKINFPDSSLGFIISGGHVYQLWDYKLEIIMRKPAGSNINFDLANRDNARIVLTRTNQTLETNEIFESVSGSLNVIESKEDMLAGAFECVAKTKDSAKSMMMTSGKFLAKY